MPTAAVREVFRQACFDAPPTDAALVTQYARHRDGAVFAELLRRHGPVVLGVCRRILRDAHDAEDAFQAVFLTLARKAGSISPPGQVGGWLYGVAVRMARKARVAAGRRRKREATVAASASTPVSARRAGASSDLERAELRAVIDDELARLPATLREPVVLCDLGGKTRATAAAELGWPEGTVAARLARARKLLADRLTRRGVALPTAGLGAALTSEVAPALARSTLAAADAFGRRLASPAVSPAARVLAEQTVRTMTVRQWQLPAVLTLVGGLLVGGLLWTADAAEGPAGAPNPPVVSVPAPPKGGKPAVQVWRERKALRDHGGPVISVAFSPDGTRFTTGGADGQVINWDTASLRKAWEFTPPDVHPAAVAYSPDGKLIAAAFRDGARLLAADTGKVWGIVEEIGAGAHAVAFRPDKKVESGGETHTSRSLVLSSGSATHAKTWQKWPKVSTATLGPPGRGGGFGRLAAPLAVDPTGQRVLTTRHEMRNGKFLLSAWDGGTKAANYQLAGHTDVVFAAVWSPKLIATGGADGDLVLWNPASFAEVRRLKAGGEILSAAFSPDGTTIAAGVTETVSGERSCRIRMWDTATGKERSAPTGLPAAGISSLAFSPDGKTLVGTLGDLYALSSSTGGVRVWTLTAP